MAGDTHCVLVVEDDGLIRLSLVEELEDAGLSVFEASSADEALKIIEEHPQIEVIFTDIDMPGSMDGLKMATLVRQSRPDMQILLTSGYLKVSKNDLPWKIPFISKPYEVDRVVSHIRSMTGQLGESICLGPSFGS